MWTLEQAGDAQETDTPEPQAVLKPYPDPHDVNNNDLGNPNTSMTISSPILDTYAIVSGGFAIKGLFYSFDIAEGGLNLFKFGSAQAMAADGWKAGDNFLFLENLGSPKLNWAQNAGRLRQAMSEAKPIFDSYLKADGSLQETRGFLNAERNLLQNHGWSFNQSMGAWMPPH